MSHGLQPAPVCVCGAGREPPGLVGLTWDMLFPKAGGVYISFLLGALLATYNVAMNQVGQQVREAVSPLHGIRGKHRLPLAWCARLAGRPGAMGLYKSRSNILLVHHGASVPAGLGSHRHQRRSVLRRCCTPWAVSRVRSRGLRHESLQQ